MRTPSHMRTPCQRQRQRQQQWLTTAQVVQVRTLLTARVQALGPALLLQVQPNICTHIALAPQVQPLALHSYFKCAFYAALALSPKGRVHSHHIPLWMRLAFISCERNVLHILDERLCDRDSTAPRTRPGDAPSEGAGARHAASTSHNCRPPNNASRRLLGHGHRVQGASRLRGTPQCVGRGAHRARHPLPTYY